MAGAIMATQEALAQVPSFSRLSGKSSPRLGHVSHYNGTSSFRLRRPNHTAPTGCSVATPAALDSAGQRKKKKSGRVNATADPAPEVIDVTATVTRAKTRAEDLLGGLTFVKASTGEPVAALSLWDWTNPEAVALICFLTHFADLTTAEYAQLIARKILPDVSNVNVAVIGLGSPDSARKFCQLFDFPLDLVLCDSDGDAYRALGFSQGFAPDAPINPYLKLLPMLAGIGSPGTIEEVLRGYAGDRQRSPIFGGTTPFDVLGTGYQRPFELATQRLLNMGTVLTNWGQLAPAQETLLTQQGGTIVFEGAQDVFFHKDSGILKYANVDKVLQTLESLKK